MPKGPKPLPQENGTLNSFPGLAVNKEPSLLQLQLSTAVVASNKERALDVQEKRGLCAPGLHFLLQSPLPCPSSES